MSALCLKADICSAPTHVRFGPMAYISEQRQQRRFGSKPDICIASDHPSRVPSCVRMNALILRRARKTEEPFAGHLSSGRVLHVGLHANVRLAPVRRLPADDEVFGQHWAPL